MAQRAVRAQSSPPPSAALGRPQISFVLVCSGLFCAFRFRRGATGWRDNPVRLAATEKIEGAINRN
jgi:hypothetical protein